jgi:hypothetical protein
MGGRMRRYRRRDHSKLVTTEAGNEINTACGSLEASCNDFKYVIADGMILFRSILRPVPPIDHRRCSSPIRYLELLQHCRHMTLHSIE